jgi:outer membrane lipoprotein LolB
MNKPFYRHLLLMLLMSLLLAACVSVTPPLTPQKFAQNQWSLQGRIAIRTANKGESASIFWQQNGEAYYMRIFGPLGIGAVQLEGVPGNVRLIENNGQLTQAATPEILIRQTLGWQLPVSNLVYWIRGKKAPHFVATQQYDSQHRLQTLQQQGWLINYLAYGANGLPQLLTCSRDQLSVRVVIDQWGG